jgi:hypothetical protein
MSHELAVRIRRTGTGSDRRRGDRVTITAPVEFRVGDQTYEGYTEDVSCFGILVHGFEALPSVGDEGMARIELRSGDVHSSARVVRVMPDRQEFALDLKHIEEGAQLLLAALILPQE